MKPLLEFLFAFSTFFFLWLSPFFCHGASEPIIINTLPNDTICPYKDPGVTLTNNTTSGIWTYLWLFEKGTPATFSGETPININWTSEGTFTITLKAYKWPKDVEPEFPLDSLIKSIEITID
jgi:hypothetical protein